MVANVSYDDLLDQIYDAALDPNGWSNVLDSLNIALNSRGFALFFQDRTTIRFNQFNGLDAAHIEAYAKHYGLINPWVPAFDRAPHSVTAAHELMGPSDLEHTEFFNDWLNPLGLHDAIGIPIRRDAGAFFLASGLRDKQAGYYTAAEKRLALRLRPHLKRAVDIYERLNAAQSLRDGLVAGMDSLDVGIMLLDEECRMLFANRVADALIKRGDGLMYCHGRVRASHANASEDFSNAVRATAATGTRRGSDSGGMVVLRSKNGKPMTALVCPRRSEADFGYRNASVMVFVSNPDAETGMDEGHAARLYGLSRAEAQLLKALLQGTRLADYADTAGITLNTAKGYLKQLFHKTGSGRQSDLMRLFFADPVLRLASGKGGGRR
jgi:DNA-binding CsgD family transcriptional regulator